MTFTLRQIEVVRAVVRTGSITEAARFLGVSQPSISATLQQCGRTTRFALFRRWQGRLVPTAEALALMPEFDRIAASMSKAASLAADLRDTSAGSVYIAATPAVAVSLLPAAVRRFGDAHPRVRIVIDSMLSSMVVDTVSAGDAELGLVMSPEEVRGATTVDLWDSELVCVVPNGHPVSRLPAATPEAVSKRRLISYGRSLPLGALVDRAFRSRGVERDVAIEVGPSALVCALVAEGAGCAVVDPFSVAHYRSWPITVMPFEPHTRLVAQLVMHGMRPLSRAANAFATCLQETAQLMTVDLGAPSVVGSVLRPEDQ